MYEMMFGAGAQVSEMYAKRALLVVLLLNVGRLAHQRPVVADDYVPAKSDDKATLDDRKTTLRAAMNAVKRHVGKFVRIGRSSLRPDDAYWSSRYAPVIPRLSERVIGDRRRRSDLYDTVDTTMYDDVWPQNADTSGLLRDAAADSLNVYDLPAESKKYDRGGGVRFVRIGKSDRQLRTSANRKRSDDVNVYKRSLENRFVRIGK